MTRSVGSSSTTSTRAMILSPLVRAAGGGERLGEYAVTKRRDKDATDGKTLARTISCRWWDQSIERLRSIWFFVKTWVVGSVRTTAHVGLKPFTTILRFLPILLDVGDVEHDTFESDR